MDADDLLNSAIAEAYASAASNAGPILYTLEFLHPAFEIPARVARWPVLGNEPERFKLRLEDDAPADAGQWVEFIACPFEVTPPAQEESAPGEFKIKIEHVGHLLAEHLEAAVRQRDPIRMVFREFLKNRPADPQLIYADYTIVRATVTENAVEATAPLCDWLTRLYGRVYTPDEWPGVRGGR